MDASLLSEAEPDLRPIVPSVAGLQQLLDSSYGLSPAQYIAVLSFLLTDAHATPYIDLEQHDGDNEDAIGLLTTTILGFCQDSTDRAIEREECVRLLVSQGADVAAADSASWTPLHYAALLAPPTLVAFLLTHSCSPFVETRRKLTPLDVISGSELVPGREDVRLLLEEAMRAEGWRGSKLETRRRAEEQRGRLQADRRAVIHDVAQILGLSQKWAAAATADGALDDEDEEMCNDAESSKKTAEDEADTNMLVFSPGDMSAILDTIISQARPTLKNSAPASAIYLLLRFAGIHCDDVWLEALLVGAVDRIEATVFNQSDDPTILAFWLHNCTALLYLLRRDPKLSSLFNDLGLFSLIEELMNAIFVFLVRFAERRFDSLIDDALLNFAPEGETVQFESEWSFIRQFTSAKRKAAGTPSITPSVSASSVPPSPTPPTPTSTLHVSDASPFSTLRQSLTKSGSGEGDVSLTPHHLTAEMAAFHTLLILHGINPALIVQAWSQVVYWTSSEMFNRILTRKRFICRSRAVQVGANLGVLEEWLKTTGLPRSIAAHFTPVHELLNWLQCLSSLTQFQDLVATIQTLKTLNPLQMRRAVRDYRYEVSEGRMTEECAQYLSQLQKDWERHRVKIGVEALRKEMIQREREREESIGSSTENEPQDSSRPTSINDSTSANRAVDELFEPEKRGHWMPPRPPEVLGELQDSRWMIPLEMPSLPAYLAAVPVLVFGDGDGANLKMPNNKRASMHSNTRMEWRSRGRVWRDYGLDTLELVDGVREARRYSTMPTTLPDDVETEEDHETENASSTTNGQQRNSPHLTPMIARKTSMRSRGVSRQASLDETPSI